jgi:hypothetical protein
MRESARKARRPRDEEEDLDEDEEFDCGRGRRSKANTGAPVLLWVGLAVVAFVVLVGGAVGAFFLLGGE